MSQMKPINAKQALAKLVQGNRRFVRLRRQKRALKPRDGDWLKEKPRGPFAIILSCSDSRAPAEILFDQGLGDLFVIRVAGNIVAPSQVGSVEFATTMAQAQLVVVMGHSECGAIKATLDVIGGKASVPAENVQAIVSRIRPHIERFASSSTHDLETAWRDSVRANVLASTDHLRHGSRFLEEQIRAGKLVVIGAEYCIETGLVDFFDNPIAKSATARLKRSTNFRKI